MNVLTEGIKLRMTMFIDGQEYQMNVVFDRLNYKTILWGSEGKQVKLETDRDRAEEAMRMLTRNLTNTLMRKPWVKK